MRLYYLYLDAFVFAATNHGDGIMLIDGGLPPDEEPSDQRIRDSLAISLGACDGSRGRTQGAVTMRTPKQVKAAVDDMLEPTGRRTGKSTEARHD